MWLDRLKIITDTEKFNNITVAIIGLGGVGGHAVESICRIGIDNIILVDNDVINITNLNRQLISLNSNINKLKTKEFKKRILNINKNCNVKLLNIFLEENNKELLFKNKIDYIIDACDTVNTKIMLIRECKKRKIKLISCMGTGFRFDPTKLEILDISKTSYDPLAKKIRMLLKKENIKQKVVCSKEKPITKSKVIGSNSIVPASAGILCASYVINDIRNK